MHPAIEKRREKLRNLGIDVGEPLTAEYDLGGVVMCGFYAGVMIAFPELDEAWFDQDAQSPFAKTFLDLPQQTTEVEAE